MEFSSVTETKLNRNTELGFEESGKISEYSNISYANNEKMSLSGNEAVSNFSGETSSNSLVSIIVAAYNCEKTIAETIESVINQSYQNWEMIIVDDCSIDNTVSIINEYIVKDNRVKIFSLEKNSGASVARNRAIKESSGRYIAFLDADDLWKPEKLKKQIEFMKNNNYSFTFTAYETFHDSSDMIRTVFSVPDSVSYKQYLKNTIIGNLTVVMDKNQIPDITIQNGFLEDSLTWMYYLSKGYIAYGLNENLASYRVTPNSKSGNKFKNARRYYECLKTQPITRLERIFCEVCYVLNATKKRVFGKKIRYTI